MPTIRAIENEIKWVRERVRRLQDELHAMKLELIETNRNLNIFKIEMGSKNWEANSDRYTRISGLSSSSAYNLHAAPAYQLGSISASHWIQKVFPFEVRCLLMGVLLGFILCANLLVP